MVCASHGVFSAESMRIIDLSVVDEVVVTDRYVYIYPPMPYSQPHLMMTMVMMSILT